MDRIDTAEDAQWHQLGGWTDAYRGLRMVYWGIIGRIVVLLHAMYLPAIAMRGGGRDAEAGRELAMSAFDFLSLAVPAANVAMTVVVVVGLVRYLRIPSESTGNMTARLAAFVFVFAGLLDLGWILCLSMIDSTTPQWATAGLIEGSIVLVGLLFLLTSLRRVACFIGALEVSSFGRGVFIVAGVLVAYTLALLVIQPIWEAAGRPDLHRGEVYLDRSQPYDKAATIDVGVFSHYAKLLWIGLTMAVVLCYLKTVTGLRKALLPGVAEESDMVDLV